MVHGPARRGLQTVLQWFAELTSGARGFPDFIIIGAQKAGTTSLLRYLEAHPAVKPARVKEIHFFDLDFARGPSWYRSFFPLAFLPWRPARNRGRTFLSGEATPYYLFHPLAPGRCSRTVPDAKLIAILRNPVDRAYSHYHHEVKAGCEHAASFEEAIDLEEQRLAGETERILSDGAYFSYSHNHHSYLARGVYVDQLAAWRSRFPQERLLVLRSEDLFANTASIFDRTLEFLGLPEYRLDDFPPHNVSAPPPMRPGTRRGLIDHFKPHNRRLSDLLDRDMEWDR